MKYVVRHSQKKIRGCEFLHIFQINLYMVDTLLKLWGHFGTLDNLPSQAMLSGGEPNWVSKNP
jgi:hypothetical protein